MTDKKKPAKTPDKKKPAKQPNKKKPAKRVPTRTYKSVKTAVKNIKSKAATKALKSVQVAVIKRNEERQAAIESAAVELRNMGYFFDKGNFLAIVERVKLILAFDYPSEMRAALERNADTTKHRLIYIEPAQFQAAVLRRTILNAVQLQKEKEVPPKKLRRSKKLSKSLDRNLA
jgi:hypothetical protein